VLDRPLHIDALERLARRVTDRREELKETMAKGLAVDEYREHVGRAKECTHTIEIIEELLELYRKGDFEDEDDDDADIRSTGQRKPATRKPHR
jgi:two-component SAPR family response regulator